MEASGSCSSYSFQGSVIKNKNHTNIEGDHTRILAEHAAVDPFRRDPVWHLIAVQPFNGMRTSWGPRGGAKNVGTPVSRPFQPLCRSPGDF